MKYILIIIVLFTVSCARISIDREKNKAHYTRIGSQNLENLAIMYNPDGTIKSIKLGKQKSSDLTKALMALKKVVEKLPVVPMPIP